jgi:enoyl-CoA hydratase/carnithine racemase
MPAYAMLETARGEGGVLVLALSNPARRNAIGPRMVNELLWALDEAEKDDSVRSVVLTGAPAGKAFSAGGDFAQLPVGEGDLPHKGDYCDLLLAMMRFPKPLVARVNGAAMGGGLGLVAACHFAVAESGARLGTPEIDVGLFPMMIMVVLGRIVPRRALVQMMLFGDKLGAAEAEKLGLVSRVVAPEELDAAVRQITDTIAGKSPITVRLGLEAMAAREDLGVREALPMLRERLAACLATEDAREGLTAFLEKRKPVWKGR